jgi:hypothetical protein
MSIDDRHRDKNGEISRKHGNTLVGTLRKIYGPSFAAGEPDSAKLDDVLSKLKLVADRSRSSAIAVSTAQLDVDFSTSLTDALDPAIERDVSGIPACFDPDFCIGPRR